MKRITAIILAVTTVILLSVFTVGTSAAWDGTTIDTSWYNPNETTFTLTTPEQLAGLAAIVNGSLSSIAPDDFKGKTILLGADIDLGGKNWVPIGTSTGASGTDGFMGIFDGQGHFIKNLTIEIETREVYGIRFGFFGIIGGTAKNINFVGANILTKDACYSGVVAGYIGGGTVSRCTVDATSVIECYTSANGMIAGRVEKGGTIDSCVNEGSIYGYGSLSGSTANVIIGGIVGLADSSVVKNCINYGNVVALAQGASPSHSGAAGISAFVKTAEIINCVNYGDISFTDYLTKNTGTGGIVGKFHASPGSVISNCYNFGNITGKDNDTTQTGLIGGLGQVISTIKNCWSVPSANLDIIGSGMISGFEVIDCKIVAQTDADYAAMESAATAIEDKINEVPIPLTIHYVYENGEKAAEDHYSEWREGDEYSIESPVLSGYVADQDTVSGKMGNTPVEITVTYKAKEFTLTIEYVFEDGSKAAEPYVDTKPYGTEFSVESPVIEGYEPNFPVVEGKFELDRTITVKYKATGTQSETQKEGGDTTTATPGTTENKKESGCKSSVGSAIILLAVFGTALVASKRKAD
ncbi:MAG: MucBP domain-containing protein [Clostridiales bacterium]|nr:MucBP domain-containing protein [Clostridiales bacterium]